MYRLAVLCLVLLSGIAAAADDESDAAIQQNIFNSYLQQAERGDANAQFVVASRYESGRGVTQDLNKAYYWYEQAAKKGQPLAQAKLDERTEERAAATRAAAPVEPAERERPPTKARPTRVEAPARAREPARPVHPIARVAAKPVEVVVARATPSEPLAAPAINTVQAVLNGKWSRNQQPAEFLPSSLTTCLQSNPSEIVCFSQELTRNVGDNGLTYTVKATLSGVNNREGRFSLRYMYNVTDINGRPYAHASGTQTDLGDLATRDGWQEPGVQLDCRLGDEHQMSCARADRKVSYQFVRN